MLHISYRVNNRNSNIVPHDTSFQSSLETLINSPLAWANSMHSAVLSYTSHARIWEDPGPFPQLIHTMIAQMTLEEPVCHAAQPGRKGLVLGLEFNRLERDQGLPVPNSPRKAHP